MCVCVCVYIYLYMYTMEYYAAIEKNKNFVICSNMDEL